MAMLGFNSSFYLQQNPDVAFAISRGTISSASEHFNNFGRFEGRNPNAFFDVTYYLTANADVAAARVNPLEHFLTFGAQEGRFTNAAADAAIDTDGNNLANEFDSVAYLAANQDVAANVGPGKFFATAYEHYILFGQFEVRQGVPATGPFTNTGAAPNTGATQTLTTGIDNLTGTNANDTFVGTVSAAATSTLQSGDVINGGAGVDTLRIVASNTGAATVAPQLSNVENIEFQGFNTAATTLNLASATGVQSVTLNNGAGSLNVTNQASLVNVGASNTTGGTLSLAYTAAAVAGTADVQAVSLSNTADTTIEVDGVETMNIAATGTNTGASVGGTAVQTVNVSGAGSLVLTNDFAATTTTFNASTNTGGVTAGFEAGGNVTATGGSGNDVFRFFGGLTTQDKVDGGVGFDTVRVELASGASDISGANAAAAFNGLTNIERVAFDGAEDVKVNGSTFTNAGITNLEFNTIGDDTIDNAGSARTYEFGTTNEGAATFNMNGTSTALNLSLLGTTGTTAVNGATNTADVGALTVALAGTQPAGTVSAITLSSLGNFTASTVADDAGTVGLTADTFNSVGTVTAASGSTLTITGNAALDIAGFTNNVTVNASALTGNLVIQGSAFTTANSGSSAGATTLTQGVDTITLGTARSVVQFAADGLDSGIIQVTGANGTFTATNNILVDTIIGFTAGGNGDVLDITGKAATYTALSATAQSDISALAGTGATLLAAADLAATAHTTDGWTAFSFQGQTYALYEDTVAATGFSNANTLVQLSGVNIADLTTANFA